MPYPIFTKQDKLENVVLDLDDFCAKPTNDCLNYLLWIKWKYPQFKVTLFAIPFYENETQEYFFREVVKFDWIQLAVHGWHHSTPRECEKWDYNTAKILIEKAEAMGVFKKIFKAPGWQISDDTYKVLLEKNYIVADHNYNEERRPKELRAYTVDHPWLVHGHTWDIDHPDPNYRNGIRQIIEEHGVPWNMDSKFYFISDLFANADDIKNPII